MKVLSSILTWGLAYSFSTCNAHIYFQQTKNCWDRICLNKSLAFCHWSPFFCLETSMPCGIFSVSQDSPCIGPIQVISTFLPMGSANTRGAFPLSWTTTHMLQLTLSTVHRNSCWLGNILCKARMKRAVKSCFSFIILFKKCEALESYSGRLFLFSLMPFVGTNRSRNNVCQLWSPNMSFGSCMYKFFSLCSHCLHLYGLSCLFS